MYIKLAFRNMRRSTKDYLIYLITITICVGLFYSVMAVTSPYYTASLPEEYNLYMLKKIMQRAVPVITTILLFLIKYVNNYMIKRKQKEFAIQTIMGMEQKTTAYLFFLETIIMSSLAIVCGIFLGTFISQFITLIVMNSFGEKYKISFSLFSDTIAITLLFFLIVFCIIGIANIRTIKKIKIIDMLNANKKTEVDGFKNDRTMPVFITIGIIITIIMIITGVIVFNKFYDSRLEIWVRIIFFGALIWPIIFILFCSLYSFMKKRNRLIRFSGLVGSLSVIGIIISIFATEMYFFISSIDSVDKYFNNCYIVAALFFLVFFIFGLYYCISDLIQIVKSRYKNIKYKDENLFLFGQLSAKLKTNSKTMAIITITLISSIVTLILSTTMSQWAKGYLDERAVFDIQIFSNYNDVEKIENLPNKDYGFVVDYLNKNEIKIKDFVQIELYFINDYDFYRRLRTDFPILGISLSNYNYLRKMAGLNEIKLQENSFATQWHSTVSSQNINEFLKDKKYITIQNSPLKISKTPYYQVSLGETLYNSYTDVIYILPDNVCKNLLVANTNFYVNTKKTLSYDRAMELVKYVIGYSEKIDKVTKNSTNINIKTLQINEGISGSLTFRLLLTYLGVILIIMCLTVLSLQQLADSTDFKYRFNVLKKLGVENTSINKIILKQMAVWFGCPILVSFLGSAIIIACFVKTSFRQLVTYIGLGTLTYNIFIKYSVIIILLLCYFIATLVSFKRNISIK
ncbi:FtsX-like permease family protein [Clostridium lundense]|uniref:FtsX-like permease family protein n=1 Tax=Clostridium lundense TaxID=319475 RepID=UPI000480131C|nr:FtsX-like permease family protein [Clostridium lundense]